MATLTKPDDLRSRMEAAVRKSGLLGDGYADLIILQPEILDRMEALAERLERVGGVDPRIVRQVARAAISSEKNNRLIVGFAVLSAVFIVLAAVAGWSFRDSMLMRHCMTLYQSDVCLAITR